MREWNSYAIEDIISAFTLTPLVPYWYAAMGKCSSEDDEENHWQCPENWDEGMKKEEKYDDESEPEGEENVEEPEEDFEVWEEKDGD